MKQSCVLLVFLVFGMVSYGTAQEQVAISTASTFTTPPTPKKVNSRVAQYYRHHRQLSARYSGYVIELSSSRYPLRRDHPLFDHFGGVFFDQLPDGSYSYAIKVDFSTRAGLKKYLKEVVQPKAPKAKLVRYRKGLRKS